MKYSSLGYHTFTIILKLTLEEARLLYRDFQKYKDAGIINIRPISNGKASPNDDAFIKWLHSGTPKYYIIEYRTKDKGIRWIMRFSNSSPDYISNSLDDDKPCSIKAIINPRVFTGVTDYIGIANESYLDDLEYLFNIETNKISPVLKEFSSYGLNRTDYCINFDVKELNIGCTAEQIIKLLKRYNTPTHFTEWTEYDENAHRNKSGNTSFYLKNNSVNINCYWKYPQLLKDYPHYPDIEESSNLIRFEVQCKYPKIYSMAKIFRNRPGFSSLLHQILSDEVSNDVIKKYFNRIICNGDYYTLDEARRIVQSKGFKPKKENRLISTLIAINNCRGISKAKAWCNSEELEDFRRTLRELSEIGINPVTIPRKFGIKRIPNLLDAYYRKIEDELFEKQQEEKNLELLKDYHGKPDKRKLEKY